MPKAGDLGIESGHGSTPSRDVSRLACTHAPTHEVSAASRCKQRVYESSNSANETRSPGGPRKCGAEMPMNEGRGGTLRASPVSDPTRLLLTLGILLLAAAMRLYGLGARPLFWEDEVGLRLYSLSGDATWMPNEAPLYSWLQFAWMWWTKGASVVSMRLLSVVLGVANAWAALALGRRVAGLRVGVLGAALVAITPMALSLSHEVRPYTLWILMSTSLLLAFVVAWERGGALRWLAYGSMLTAALASHLMTAQICLALGVTAIAASVADRSTPEAVRRFACFAGASVIFGLIGISWLLFRPDQAALVSGPYTGGVLAFGEVVLRSLGGGVAKGSLVPALAMTALAGIGCVVLARKRPVAAILFASLILISCLLTYLTMESMSDRSWLGWRRYLSHLLVPYLLLSACGTVWIADLSTRRFTGARASTLAGAILLVPVLLVLPGTADWLRSPKLHTSTAKLEHYARFAEQHQHEVLGILLVEVEGLRAPGLSLGHMRRRYLFEQVRRDVLPTYSLSRFGAHELEMHPSRAYLSTLITLDEASQAPEDGKYIVFPPTVGCQRLLRDPIRGAEQAVQVHAEKWGRICWVGFGR